MSKISHRRIWRRPGRFIVFCLTAMVALASAFAQTNSAPTGPPPAPRRPSIILILADNIGYGDLGCYGQTKIKTPNLDKLASEGVRFTSFYAASPEDLPSRAALMTGLEPGHNRAGFNQPLAPDAFTVAAFLKQSGYRTGLIGEWGLGDTGSATPDKKGFDEFAGYLSQGHARNYYTDRLWRHDPTSGFDAQETITENQDGKHGRYIPDLLTSAAMNFVRIHKSDKFNHYLPFFLCLAYPIPHPTGAALPDDISYANESWPQPEKNRAAMITRMDASIGKLLDKLAQLKIDTNTVIIFTSVNGPQKENNTNQTFFDSTGPLRGLQGSVYEGGLRVPMIVRWPAKIKGGRVSDFAWAGWDFLPTAAELALAKPPEKTGGISVLPTLLDRAQTNRHEFFYWESRENGFRQAVRVADWKGIRTELNGPLELYNLKTDIGEKRNVAGKNPDAVAKVEKYLNSSRATQGGQPATPAKE
jgi:arylsulfatase A-like enzyme